MKLYEARSLTKFWQSELGLGEWDIRVRWATSGDYGEDEYFGWVLWFTEECTATMILDRRKADERTIVHELLHLRLEGHRAFPFKYDPLYEQGINKLVAFILKRPQ